MRSLARPFAVAIVAIVAAASTVHAQPRDVDKTFQAGVDAFRLGKYAEARELLDKARTMDPELPGPHRFLAAVARAERRWDDCVASAREAIRLKPDSAEVGATREIHDACRAALGRSPFTGTYGSGGAIAISANVDGAAITLGGLRYGVTPLVPRSIATGKVEIEITKTGWLPVRVATEVLPQIVTDVVVTLDVDPDAKPETDGPPVDPMTHGWLVVAPDVVALRPTIEIDGAAVTTAAELVLPGGVHEVLVEAPGREPWRRRVRITRGQRATVAMQLPRIEDARARRNRGLVVLGGAGGAAIVGIVAALISKGAAEDARDIWTIETSRPPTVPLDDTTPIEPLRTRDDLEALRDKARLWSIVSLVSYGAAIAAGGVSAYILLRERRGDVEGYPAPFAITPVEGGAVVAREIAW